MKNLKILLVVGILSTSTVSNAAVVNFNKFSNGDYISTLDFGKVSADLTVTGGLELARIYDTNNSSNGDSDLNGPFYKVKNNGNGYVQKNGQDKEFNLKDILIIQEKNGTNLEQTPDDNANGGVIEFKFDGAITLKSLDYVDVSKNNFIVSLFDINGIQIGNSFSNSIGADDREDVKIGDNKFGTLKLGKNGVADVYGMTVSFNGASGGLDNIRYDVFEVPVSAVPEPSAITLMAGGLGLVGFMVARRRKQ